MNLIYHKFSRGGRWEIRTKAKASFPNPSLLTGSVSLLTPLRFIPYLGAPEGYEIGVEISLQPFVSLFFLLTFFLCSHLKLPPWEKALHELFLCGSFLGTAVLQEQLQHGFFPWAAVLQEHTTSRWVPHEIINLDSRPESRDSPSPPWPAALIRYLSLCGLPEAMTFFRTQPAEAGTSVCCRRISTMVPRVPPSPPFPLTLVSRELFLWHTPTLFSQLLFQSWFFFTFLSTLSQTDCKPCWGVQFWPTEGQSWSCLAMALCSLGATGGVSSQKHLLLSLPAAKTSKQTQ